jgi:hypothetical protein
VNGRAVLYQDLYEGSGHAKAQYEGVPGVFRSPDQTISLWAIGDADPAAPPASDAGPCGPPYTPSPAAELAVEPLVGVPDADARAGDLVVEDFESFNLGGGIIMYPTPDAAPSALVVTSPTGVFLGGWTNNATYPADQAVAPGPMNGTGDTLSFSFDTGCGPSYTRGFIALVGNDTAGVDVTFEAFDASGASIGQVQHTGASGYYGLRAVNRFGATEDAIARVDVVGFGQWPEDGASGAAISAVQFSAPRP